MATAKPKAMKWKVGGDEPEDLDDFVSAEELRDKHAGDDGVPVWPKGLFRLKAKRIKVKDNKNGDPRLNILFEISEKKGSGKDSWNGYGFFDGFNVDGGTGDRFLKRWLVGMGLTWSDFVNKTKFVDTDDDDVKEIVQIGNIKFGSLATTDPLVFGALKVNPARGEYDESTGVSRYIVINESDEEDGEEDEEPDEEDAESEDEDEAEDEDADSEEDDEEGGRDEEAEEELLGKISGLTIPNLRKRAIRAGADGEEVAATKKKDELLDLIVLWELYDGTDPDEEDEDEDEDEEEEGEEEGEDEEEEEDGEDAEATIRAKLAGLDRNALKARLKAINEEFKVLKRHTDDDLRDAIVDGEMGAGEDEDEPPF